jgi:predicted O-methyltransferase YrrM
MVKVRGVLARDTVRVVAAFAGQRLIPLDVVRAIRLVGAGSSPLTPASKTVDGRTLRIAPLADLLDGVQLGMWTLGPRSLEALAEAVARRRPRMVIEFGSGVSTVALAWALREALGHSDLPRLVSIEQESTHADRTRVLLASVGLDDECIIVPAPLDEQIIEGVRTTCYSLPDGWADALAGRRADMVVIDGPAGIDGIRFGTLPLVSSVTEEGATFILDDALRDGELDIARRWRRLPYVEVDGISLVEHGLLQGRLVHRESR